MTTRKRRRACRPSLASVAEVLGDEEVVLAVREFVLARHSRKEDGTARELYDSASRSVAAAARLGDLLVRRLGL